MLERGKRGSSDHQCLAFSAEFQKGIQSALKKMKDEATIPPVRKTS